RNFNKIKIEEAKLLGFCQVLHEGKVTLLKKPYASIKEANYNVTLNVGNRNDKIYTYADYYILKDDGAQKIKSKKDLLDVLYDKAGDVKSYMKENKTNPKEEASLTQLVIYYNNLPQ
ncbi:MAG: hypothetical protein AAFU64_09805, partial [Bacteroidota bacterium]